MEPSNVVMAKGHQNVTLKCMMTAGNPKIVDTVRWFLNGSLLKELSCDPTNDNSKGNSSLCPIDVSQLLLKDVNKGFAGNYSCDASSFAGLGHRSKETQLIVYCKFINGILFVFFSIIPFISIFKFVIRSP